jgi:decaprenylphospho-beta-D-erythro-pentofuranosid-2-ulose 2-reductase
LNDALGMPQTAVVLGGTSDIARAVMRLLATRRLNHVLLAGRDEVGLQAASKELHALGVSKVETLVWDVNAADHSKSAAEASSRLGEIDLVVMAVGVLGDQERCESDPSATASVISTNFSGPAASLVAFADVMKSQGHGRIVVLSSVAGVRVRRSNFVYGASKAGLDGFAQGLAAALRPTGVALTIVRPGWVATRMTAGRAPGPMATTPEAVASDVVRGIENRSPVVWSPSALKLAFSVLRLLPAALWRRMPG